MSISKNRQIEELKVALADAEDRAYAAEDARLDAHHQCLKEKAEAKPAVQASARAETLKHIANGLVPIEVLRNVICAGYTTEHTEDFTERTLLDMGLTGGNEVHDALLKALVNKPVEKVLGVETFLTSDDMRKACGALLETCNAGLNLKKTVYPTPFGPQKIRVKLGSY